MRNLHTTTCNLLVNFTTPTHSVCRSSLQADYSCTVIQSFLTSVQSTHSVCMQLCTGRYSLSLYVLLTLPVFMMLAATSYFCVIQNDRTPLLWASGRGHTEIVVMLLKFGADFNSCDTVSTSYFITPISAVSEYVAVYTYVNLILVTLSTCMCSEGYCTCSLCLPVSTCCLGSHKMKGSAYSTH